jgi:formate/nitrite transporter FocA (FNT family)
MFQKRRQGSTRPKANTDAVSGPPTDEPKVASQEILQHELNEAMDALGRSAPRLVSSGTAAGLEVGFSLFLMGVMHTLTAGHFPEPVVRLLVANMYSFGFILVVLGRSEFFTEQTSLAVMPVLNGQASLKALARLWSIIYVSNIVGAAGFAALAVLIGPPLGVIDNAAFRAIAHPLVDHPAHVIVLSGVLAGWLMGLLSWLVAAGRDTISQIVIVWMITAAIGLAHLHHAILGSVEVLAGVFSSQVTLGDFGHFLLWATLGNMIGGPVFVALLKFTHSRGPTKEEKQAK